MWIREGEGGSRIWPKNRRRGATNRNLVCGGAQATGPWSWKDGLHCYELQRKRSPLSKLRFRVAVGVQDGERKVVVEDAFGYLLPR